MPRNASINGDGFRMYQWPGGDTPLNRRYNATEASDLLSVTSIRSLAGEPFQLVNWKISNVVNLAMGVRKSVRVGPKGGVYDIYVPDGPFPGEFVARMLAVKDSQAKRDDLRRWLRSTADEPRDIAAVRGSVVHKMIEQNLTLDVIDEAAIRKFFAKQWAEEKRKVKPDVIEDDVNFVGNAMAQYWDMRAHVPFVVVAQEPQVYNLTAGYAGSLDVLMWFLGHFAKRGDKTIFVPLDGFDPATPGGRAAIAKWQKGADKGTLELAHIETVGGFLAVGDWKTAKGVYTNHVVQTTAYMAGEFVAYDGLIDERLSAILAAAMSGMVVHIRPNFWVVDIFDFRQDVLRGFLGSVAFARLLAMHKQPGELFAFEMDGSVETTEESQVIDDGE